MMRRFLKKSLRKPSSQKSRGQVIILGAMMVLILVLALMMTMGVTWSVRERIRVQNAADANAYSSAVQVARAYNYFAYSNRAIAGAYVSMTILSAYHSEISAAADLYWSIAFAHFGMAGIEFAMGCCGDCLFSCCPCLCFQHCEHAIEDIETAIDFLSSASDIADDIQALDSPFRESITAFDDMVKSLEDSETMLKNDLQVRLVGLGGVDLGSVNVPNGSAKSMVLGAMNRNHFLAAIDDSDNSSVNKKQRDITEMVNSARPEWTRRRGSADYIPSMAFTTVVLLPLSMKIRQKGGGTWGFVGAPYAIGGAAGMVPDQDTGFFSSSPPDPDNEGKNIGSHDWWTGGGICKHNCAPGGLVAPFLGPIIPADIYSGNDEDHGWALFEDPHSGSQHNQMKPDKTKKYLSYKGKQGANWNMPAMYGYAEQALDKSDQPGGKRQPFFMTSSGSFKNLLFGSNSLDMVDNKVSKAVSKALVYYHRQGDWQEPPNFFNPYWRAKLHPFSRTEFATVAAAAGDPSAMALSILDIGLASNDVAMAP